MKGTERVLCLDEKTGKELWKHEYPAEYAISYAAGPRCTPTVDGDRVYTLGAMGDLFCLNAADGKPVWSKNFIKDYDVVLPVWGFAAHPLVDGDKLHLPRRRLEQPARGRVRQEDRQGAVGGARVAAATSATARR